MKQKGELAARGKTHTPSLLLTTSLVILMETKGGTSVELAICSTKKMDA